MKRHYASLTPQEALHVAIFIEERNCEIYQQFSELFAGFEDPESLEIAATFRDMAEEERGHGTILQRIYSERYGTKPCAVTDDDVRDLIEVPQLQNGNIFAIARSNVSRAPRKQALEIALHAEQSALKYYSRLMELTDDPELRSLYEELADFENEHTELLKRKIETAAQVSSEEA